MIDVIRLLDGAIAMLPCVSLHYYEPCDECKNEASCGIRDTFIQVRDKTLSILEKSTLAEMLKRQHQLNVIS
jgi:DNA-binding IscR family transcriptional regulator